MGLGRGSLPKERISALGASVALFVAPEWKFTPTLGFLFVIVLSHTHKANTLLHVKVSPRGVVVAQSAPTSGLL
jgi:hypothetical protein